MIFKFLAALLKRKNKVSSCSFMNTIFKDCSKSASNFCSGFPSAFGDFSYIQSWLAHRTIFIGSKAASGTTFRVYRSFPNRVTGFSQLVSDFIEISKDFISDFLTRRQPEINHQRSFTKYCFDFQNLKKCSTRDTVHFNQNFQLSLNLPFFISLVKRSLQ